MFVLSRFYWMLTKMKTQSLCGDYRPEKTKNSNDGLQLKDKTAYAGLVGPSQEIYFFGGLSFIFSGLQLIGPRALIVPVELKLAPSTAPP
jgi:hypothetical protein